MADVHRATTERVCHHALRVLGYPHVTRDAHDALGVLHHPAHAYEQRVARKDRVGVDAGDEPIAGDVDACVQRVSLAAVPLVHDDEVRNEPAAIGRPNRLGRERRPHRHVVLLELEGLDDPVERPVLRAVVHDDDLELGIVD